MTPYERVIILDHYEYRNRVDSETVFHVLRAPMHAATLNSTTL